MLSLETTLGSWITFRMMSEFCSAPANIGTKTQLPTCGE